MAEQPLIVVLGGPNGAGKSTAAAYLLPEGMVFVNADEIAKTLPDYPSRSADIEASRVVLAHMDELERDRADFAVETTLASRSLAPRIARLRSSGYYFRLIFVFVPTVNLSIQRVAGRVRQGGHHIPEGTIRRRYVAGIKNFFELYQPVADIWGVYDTTQLGPPRALAEGIMSQEVQVVDPVSWRAMRGKVYDE